jgi:hypothetical protein
MAENYYEPPNGFWLEIHRMELAEDHAAEMFAQFDLGLLEGWLRFEAHDAESAGVLALNRVDRQLKGIKVKLGSKLEPVKTVVREWKNLEYTY